MSSPLRKIQKNNENEFMEQMVKNLTPKQYMENIQKIREQLHNEYNNKLIRIATEYDKQLHDKTQSAINTISVELLYELANQMGCFDEEPELLEEKINKVQEIYENTMESIKKYSEYKRPSREFKKKQNKVAKLFKILF